MPFRQGSLDRWYKTTKKGSTKRKRRGRPRKYAISYSKLTTKQRKARQQLLSVKTVETIAKKIVDKNKEENSISHTDFAAPIDNATRGGRIIGNPLSTHSIQHTILGDGTIPKVADNAMVGGVIDIKGKRLGESINLKGLQLKMLFTSPDAYQSFCKVRWIFYRKKGSAVPLCNNIHFPNNIWIFTRDSVNQNHEFEPQYQTIKSGWVDLSSKAVKKMSNSSIYDVKQESKFIDMYINLKNVKFEFEGNNSVKSNYGLIMYCYCEKQAVSAVGQQNAGYFVNSGQQGVDVANHAGDELLHPTVSYAYTLYYTDTT